MDSEPNFVKAVTEPGAPGESSPSCFKASSLRLSEAILTLLRLRMKPFEEAPTKRGRSKGRQAPTMPMEDSTIGQYTRGEFISARTNQTGDEIDILEFHTADIQVSYTLFFCVLWISILRMSMMPIRYAPCITFLKITSFAILAPTVL